MLHPQFWHEQSAGDVSHVPSGRLQLFYANLASYISSHTANIINYRRQRHMPHCRLRRTILSSIVGKSRTHYLQYVPSHWKVSTHSNKNETKMHSLSIVWKITIIPASKQLSYCQFVKYHVRLNLSDNVHAYKQCYSLHKSSNRNTATKHSWKHSTTNNFQPMIYNINT